ncbi:uncharacterized protein LOC144111348 [Amblyomma americanum]
MPMPSLLSVQQAFSRYPQHVQPRRHVHCAATPCGSPGQAAPRWHHRLQASGKAGSTGGTDDPRKPAEGATCTVHVPGAASSRTTPSSRLSSSSRSLSVHASLPSFIGSPEMQLGHMEPQPLVEQELRTERSAVPPSPSMYLHAKEEWQRSPVYMWSGGSQDLNYCQSKANPGELSRSWDTKLCDEHLSAKKESDASASYEAWEAVPFFCTPTNDTPLPPTSSDYAHPHQEPQLAPGQELHSPPELSFERQQEQEAMMPQQQFLPRLGPPHSRKGTLPYWEPPLLRQFLWPPQGPKLPRGPTSPARQEEAGQWGAVSGLWARYGPLKWLGLPCAREPVFSAIVIKRRAVMLDDGVCYILAYPTVPQNHECLAWAVWHWDK